MDRRQFLDLIQANIDQYAYHLTIVTSGRVPRYAYTIGLSKQLNFELVMLGGFYYEIDDLSTIFEYIIEGLKKEKNAEGSVTKLDNLGTFSLASVDQSWTTLIMLGVFDYYKISKITAFQIVPDKEHFTFEIPDMSKQRSTTSQPVWKWLTEDWNLPVPKSSRVITNLIALQRQKITEIVRWEEDEWEMFVGSGDDVSKKDIRIVPFGTILGLDESILPAINLDIGQGIWRDHAELTWNNWD